MRREEFECIGVDVSKKTLDVALFHGKVDWSEGHIKVDNNSSGYKELKRWLRLKNAKKKQLRICMEATGLYTHDFRSWLEQEGIIYYVVDQADAFRIAIYCSLFHDSMEPSRLPSAAYFKLKRLLAERRQYVKQSVLYKQQLHDISVYDSAGSVARKKDEVKILMDNVKQTDAEMMAVMATDPTIKKNYELLTSIVGVGIVVAVTTIVLTENFTTFTNPRKYASYIAIAPFPHESGTSVRGATRVSRQGFRQAKADLSISVLTTITRDPDIREYWQRKKAEGKHAGCILNAIKFKIVLRMFAVVKRGKPYVNTKGYKG